MGTMPRSKDQTPYDALVRQAAKVTDEGLE
jgi:hypothetical protein